MEPRLRSRVRYYKASECLVHFRTNQGVKLQKLFESLAPLVVEGNIVFSPSGVRLKTVTSKLFADFELQARNLLEYKCVDAEQVVGVNFTNLFKFFKTVTQPDAIAIQITEDSLNASYPHMMIHIITPAMTNSYRYFLLSLDEVPFEIPSQQFDTVVRVDSVAFLRAIRSCEQVGESVQIMSRAITETDDQGRTKPNVLIYILCQGTLSDLLVTINPCDGLSDHEVVPDDEEESTSAADTDNKNKNNNNNNNNQTPPVPNPANKSNTDNAPETLNTSDKNDVYMLKLLSSIAKATSLSSKVKLFLARDYALVLEYSVGKMGRVTFGVPMQMETSDVSVDDLDESTSARYTIGNNRHNYSQQQHHSDVTYSLPDVLAHKRNGGGKGRRGGRKHHHDDDQPSHQHTAATKRHKSVKPTPDEVPHVEDEVGVADDDAEVEAEGEEGEAEEEEVEEDDEYRNWCE